MFAAAVTYLGTPALQAAPAQETEPSDLLVAPLSSVDR